MKAEDDGGARLERFNVAHASCGGVTFSEPTEADIDIASGRLRLWVNERCNGCGATIRESQDAETMMRDFTALVEAAGISPADPWSGDTVRRLCGPRRDERQDQGRPYDAARVSGRDS